MKRFLLKVLICILLVSDLYLCSAFLPTRWQIAIQQVILDVVPHKKEQSTITHAAIDEEINQVLRENPPLHIAAYALVVLLIGLNTFLMVACWKLLQALNRSQLQKDTALSP